MAAHNASSSSSSSSRTTTKLPNPQTFNPTPYQLRSLVLDYLCHHCYTRTAEAFARDSSVRHLDADGDEIVLKRGDDHDSKEREDRLKDVKLREEIRIHILSGRVDEATILLERHYPSVLSPTYASTAGKKNYEPSSISGKRRMDSIKLSSGYVPPTSMDAAHLALNLRILAFIEACRTVPLPYPPPDPSSYQPETRVDDATMDIDDASTEAEDDNQLALLSRGQKLYELAKMLPKPSDQAIYLKELENVAGLLVYKVPEKSSIARYLSQERREAVADQINGAILNSQGRPPVPLLEVATRSTEVVWGFANQFKVKPKAGAMLPPGSILGSIGDGRPGASSTKSGTDKEEVVPTFDLHVFLDQKT